MVGQCGNGTSGFHSTSETEPSDSFGTSSRFISSNENCDRKTATCSRSNCTQRFVICGIPWLRKKLPRTNNVLQLQIAGHQWNYFQHYRKNDTDRSLNRVKLPFAKIKNSKRNFQN